ncbi:35438_t:CDS:2, partial [Racocetra persica]
ISSPSWSNFRQEFGVKQGMTKHIFKQEGANKLEKLVLILSWRQEGVSELSDSETEKEDRELLETREIEPIGCILVKEDNKKYSIKKLRTEKSMKPNMLEFTEDKTLQNQQTRIRNSSTYVNQLMPKMTIASYLNETEVHKPGSTQEHIIKQVEDLNEKEKEPDWKGSTRVKAFKILEKLAKNNKRSIVTKHNNR